MDFAERSLGEYNISRTGQDDYAQIGVFIRDADKGIHGALLGEIWGGWLHVDTLWVEEGLRGKGFGTRLLKAGEQAALSRGCHGVYLDTHTFQARPFYERFGYTVFGQIDDYPPGHSAFFMLKRLDDE